MLFEHRSCRQAVPKRQDQGGGFGALQPPATDLTDLQGLLISQNESMRWELVEVERAGIGMVICGMILVIWTALQYRRVRRQIDRGDFRPDSRIIWTIAFVIVVGGGLSLLCFFTAEDRG